MEVVRRAMQTSHVRRAWRRVALSMLLVAPVVASGQVTGIRNTAHNLSASSSNTVRAASETQICVYCHTPHSGQTDAPLWNRRYSSQPYTPYNSPSLQASPGVPTGYSKLCLSCHDGSIAIGDVMRPPAGTSGVIAMLGTAADGTMPPGRTLIGSDLRSDHPVSFEFTAALRVDDGELADPSTLNGVRLFGGGPSGTLISVQCTSCHDPHTDQQPKFLRKVLRGRIDNLCLSCHTKTGWSGSTHESSTLVATIDGTTAAVNQHSCMSCHAPHTVDGAQSLLRNAASSGASAIERACYNCHTSTGPAQNIQGEIAKAGSRHPVESATAAGLHRPVFLTMPSAGLPENVQLAPGQPAPDARFTDGLHVECVDCHNPHRVKSANKLEGMRGIGLNGSVVENVRNDSSSAGLSQQFTVCLRCHGDTYTSALPTTLASGLTPSNKRAEFQTTNSAYHPVGGPGRNLSANLNAQLMPNGLSVNATIRCTDCHNSNAYAITTGRVVPTSGNPSGPHGSTNPSILRANYRSTLGVSSYNANNFALCFRCHSESALLGTSTNFYDDIKGKGNLHQVHLDDRISKTGATCKSCHYNIHSNVAAPNTQYNVNGVVYAAPPSTVPTRNVNFHPNIRATGARSRPEWWINTSTRERHCDLQCHTVSGGVGGTTMNGADHKYRPPSGDLP